MEPASSSNGSERSTSMRNITSSSGKLAAGDYNSFQFPTSEAAMKMLVLAAGYATRLRPLTDNQAKPLLPVQGLPMIDHVLGSVAGCADIDHVYVVTNHRFAPNFQAWAALDTARKHGW